MSKYHIIMIISVLVASVSQVLLKKSAGKEYDALWKEYVNVEVICGYCLLVLSTILTILALRGMAYKNVPVIEALGYLFIMFLSRVFFKEKITRKKIAGNLLIVVGMLVFYI